MQTGRLFEIIYLLMDKSPLTTKELSRMLEVSSRTIRRDVETLSAAGVPVYMTRGKAGGVHLMPHYVLDKSVLSEAEQTEILSALSALKSTGVGQKSAHDRLSRIFQREAIEWIDIDFSFWGAPADYKQTFEVIKNAITTRSLLSFEYYDAAGTVTTRTVEPVRLDFKEYSWYLRAYCRKRNDWRIFKLMRIKWPTLTIIDETFTARSIPCDLDAAPRTDGAATLKLLFEKACENRVREEFAPSSIEIQKDGRLLVTLLTPESTRTNYYLLSYGSHLEVLEPAPLKAWIADQIQSMAKKYSVDF